jgi:hypothetical protein
MAVVTGVLQKRRVLGHRAVVAAWALVASIKGRIGVVRYLIGIL